MCMSRKACDHDAWAKKKKERWGNKRNNSNNSNDGPATKIQLIKSMREALVTKGNMTLDQATALSARIQPKMLLRWGACGWNVCSKGRSVGSGGIK